MLKFDRFYSTMFRDKNSVILVIYGDGEHFLGNIQPNQYINRPQIITDDIEKSIFDLIRNKKATRFVIVGGDIFSSINQKDAQKLLEDLNEDEKLVEQVEVWAISDFVYTDIENMAKNDETMKDLLDYVDIVIDKNENMIDVGKTMIARMFNKDTPLVFYKE